MAKSRKPLSLQLKRTKLCNFWGLKAVWRKNYDYKPQFVLEILRAVCLSVDWVPKWIQNFFPTMEQKLIQHWETEIVVDACNASYLAATNRNLLEGKKGCWVYHQGSGWKEGFSLGAAFKESKALIWTLSKTGPTHPPHIFGSFGTLFGKSKLLELLVLFCAS